MIEKYRFEIGVAGAAAAIVLIMVKLGPQVNSAATAVGAWLLMCFILVLTLAWINA